VDLMPMPNLSYEANSQLARLRAVRGELSSDVHASRTADDDLNGSIEAGIAQASVMWLLHRGSEVLQDRGESLEQQSSGLAPLYLMQSEPAIRCYEMPDRRVSGLFISRDC
jgi:hypothetical protein